MTPAVKKLVLGECIDADTRLWRSSIRADGKSVSRQTVRIVDRFLTRPLKATGLWNKCYVIDPCVGDSMAASFHRLKVPSGVSRKCSTGGMVDSDYNETGASGGRKGNGTSKYIDTLINPVSLSFSLTSFMMFVYARSAAVAGTSGICIGSQGGGGGITAVGWLNAGTQEISPVGAANNTEYPAGSATSLTGLIGGGTNGSRVHQFYANGSAVGASNTGSSGFSNLNLYAFATNATGGAAAFTARYLSSMFMTTGLSSAEVVTLNAIVHAFETALGRKV